jgi:hypothetical protein
LLGEADRERVSVSNKRDAKEQRFIDQFLEPAIIGKARVLKSELHIPFRVAVDELIQAEFLNEATKLTERSGALIQVDEVSLDPSLRKESQSLSGVRAPFDAKDLNFHRLRELIIDRAPPCSEARDRVVSTSS